MRYRVAPPTNDFCLIRNWFPPWLNCVIQPTLTTANHTAADGLVEIFHQSLNGTIMCHADQQRPFSWISSAYHNIQNGPPIVNSRARLRGANENSRRAIEPDDWLSGTSAVYHAAPPEASSGNTPHLPSNISAQGPPKLPSHLSPPGRNSAGSGAPLDRPLQATLAEAEDDETLCARHTRVDRHG
jgi:hypothetical protein